jgi:Zn-dependent M28 family amino/carboxypeptidase
VRTGASRRSGVKEEVQVERLRLDVQALAGDIGERHVFAPQALRSAAAHIRQTWERQCYAVEAQQYEAAGVRVANLAVTRPGAQARRGILLVGAHYDTVLDSPGADDNASGVAALLELSRLFRHVEPALTLRFVAFVNEEAPFFYSDEQGSMVYASAARRRGDDIRLMLSLEMLGYYSGRPGSQRYPPLLRFFYPDRADFIALVSDLGSRRLLRRLATAFREACDFPMESLATPPIVPGVALSDHLSFWRNGYRAVMVTDTAFYRNPFYHTPDDRPETLDYPRLAAVTGGLYAALLRLAEAGV